MNRLLSRYAECVFWLARYIERAENLARILDVHETFARDSRGKLNWDSVLHINADTDRFAARHRSATAAAVLDFYVLDQENPSSILSCVRAARENARTLRPLISTEMWTHVNVFYNSLRELGPGDVTVSGLGKLCQMVKEACQTHYGITEGTFFRDESWYFYGLGKTIERADQTSRILDIKYHVLQPRDSSVGAAIEISQWNALLRSVAGYHAFRRIHPRGMTPAAVAGFLLFDTRFPRSVRSCVLHADDLLNQLRSRHALRGGGGALEGIDELGALLGELSIERVLKSGLHEFVDAIQRQLINVTSEIAHDFFGTPRPEAAAA